MLQAQHRGSDDARLRASDAHNPDAASARRSGDGNDGVVEVHEEIVAGESASNDGRVIQRLGAAGNFTIATINEEIIESRTEWEEKIQG